MKPKNGLKPISSELASPSLHASHSGLCNFYTCCFHQRTFYQSMLRSRCNFVRLHHYPGTGECFHIVLKKGVPDQRMKAN